jgi:hypothetical protein
MSPDPALGAALAPVREAMLAAARCDADDELSAAVQTAQARLRDAETEAARTRAQARARGVADAAVEVTRQRSRAGAQARSLLLATRRDEYVALRRAARSAVAQLREAPDYPALRERMVAAVRRVLGPDAQVDEVDGGGVIATAPGRRVDYSLASVADQVVDEVAAELESS